ETIARGVEGWIRADPDAELVVSGGGAKNPVLVEQLGARVRPRPVLPFDRLFFDGEAKEALAFAFLGFLTIAGKAGNLPEATHACGIITATEARAAGINWVFAPVCDLDIEPKNPIVQTRSFGADPTRVGEQAAVWVRGCQEHGALACAKHYPGHGRTTQDSHQTLPRVTAPAAELERVDLAPFEATIRAAVASVMSAFVAYRDWDPSGRAASFSSVILGHLRDSLNFGGLVVTDALIMAGASAVQPVPDASVA